MNFFYMLMYEHPLISLGVIATLVFAVICSAKVKSVYSKYGSMYTSGKIPACEVARQILDANGLYNVQIVRCSGNLTDHYDPKNNVIALSDTVYGSPTVGAIGVAAHECGHAIQYATGYGPIKARNTMAPIVSICSSSWIWIFIVGGIIGSIFMTQVAIAFYAVVVLFQLVTLPVEFNASKRAMDTVLSMGFLHGNELMGARKVLTAAAMTYVASLLVSTMQLIRLILRMNRRRD